MSSSDEDEASEPELETLDISNDKYYQSIKDHKPKHLVPGDDFDIPKYGSSTIQHSLPAYDLWRPFYPTYLSEDKCHNFHRPKLRHYNIGPQALARFKEPKAFPVKNLARCLYKYQKRLRNKVVRAINAGMTRDAIVKNILLIRNARDLTAKRGELFLFEYCEEYPPVLNQPGMASNVKTLIQPASGHTNGLPKTVKPVLTDSCSTNGQLDNTNTKQPQTTADIINSSEKTCNPTQTHNPISNNYKIGFDQVLTNNPKAKQIYYHQPEPGSKLKVIENNMYRAPIYQHEMPSCDFIIIRTRNGFYIRTVQTIFTVGQTMPLVAIPEPSENAINRFRLDLSNCYIHKLFKESITEPPTMNLKTLHKYFPDYDIFTLRRRVKHQGVKVDYDDSYFQGTSSYGLSSLKDLRRRFTPEQYCLNMAMLSARDRLRVLNYTESMISPANADAELETEVLAAPWNTSKAVLKTISGKSYLDLNKHLIDPTGKQRCEGFSCVSWVKSPTEEQQQKSQQTGLANGNNLPSTQPTLFDKNPLLLKIRNEKLERLAAYRNKSQHISKIQSEVLASKEILSSDEEEDEMVGVEEEGLLETSFNEQLRDLDRLVNDGRSVNELTYEREEEERQTMLKEFMHNGVPGDRLKESSKQSSQTNSTLVNVADYKNKVLRITRFYDTSDGGIEPRVEIVREPKIIALYIKQKSGSSQAPTLDKNIKTNGRNNPYKHLSYSMTNGILKSPSKRRRSLGPMELCRAEGTRLTISKSVLDHRAMRHFRREARTSNDVTLN